MVILIFTFVQPINFIVKLFVVPLLKRKVPDFWYVCPFFVFLLFYFSSGGNAFLAIKIHLFLYGVFGFCFSRVLFCGHRLQELWTEGAERIEDFGEHTMASTNDTDVQVRGLWSYFLLGGFNLHTPHHMFPTADHHFLGELYGVVREVCAEEGVKNWVHNRLTCIQSLSKAIVQRIPYEKE